MTESGVQQMLAGMGGSAPPSGLSQAVFKETEGNPFFVGRASTSTWRRKGGSSTRPAPRGPISAWVRSTCRKACGS